MEECRKIEKNLRVLITTLTKDAEKITDYLNENQINSRYMHSDIETLDRIELIKELRIGTF